MGWWSSLERGVVRPDPRGSLRVEWYFIVEVLRVVRSIPDWLKVYRRNAKPPRAALCLSGVPGCLMGVKRGLRGAEDLAGNLRDSYQ